VSGAGCNTYKRVEVEEYGLKIEEEVGMEIER